MHIERNSPPKKVGAEGVLRVLLGVLMGVGIAEAEGQPPTVLTTQGNPG